MMGLRMSLRDKICSFFFHFLTFHFDKFQACKNNVKHSYIPFLQLPQIVTLLLCTIMKTLEINIGVILWTDFVQIWPSVLLMFFFYPFSKFNLTVSILELSHLINHQNLYGVITGEIIRLPGGEPDFATHRLYDLGQVTSLLCASMLSFVKWL